MNARTDARMHTHTHARTHKQNNTGLCVQDQHQWIIIQYCLVVQPDIAQYISHVLWPLRAPKYIFFLFFLYKNLLCSESHFDLKFTKNVQKFYQNSTENPQKNPQKIYKESTKKSPIKSAKNPQNKCTKKSTKNLPKIYQKSTKTSTKKSTKNLQKNPQNMYKKPTKKCTKKYQTYKLILRHSVAQYELVDLIFLNS